MSFDRIGLRKRGGKWVAPMLLNSCSLGPRKYIEFLSAILRTRLPVMCGAAIMVYPASLRAYRRQERRIIFCTAGEFPPPIHPDYKPILVPGKKYSKTRIKNIYGKNPAIV